MSRCHVQLHRLHWREGRLLQGRLVWPILLTLCAGPTLGPLLQHGEVDLRIMQQLHNGRSSFKLGHCSLSGGGTILPIGLDRLYVAKHTPPEEWIARSTPNLALSCSDGIRSLLNQLQDSPHGFLLPNCHKHTTCVPCALPRAIQQLPVQL